MKFDPRRRIAWRLILFIFPCVSLAFLVIFSFTYRFSKDMLERSLQENALNMTQAVVGRMEGVLSPPARAAENTARLLEILPYSKSDIMTLLRALMDNNPEVYGTTLAFEPNRLDPQAHFFAPYFYRQGGQLNFKYLGNETYDYFSMDWYRRPREQGRPVWSEPYVDTGGGQALMCTYSVPIYRRDDGKARFLAVLTIDVALEHLQRLISAIHVYRTGYSFLISRSGRMIVHPLREVVLNDTIFSIAEKRNSPALREIGQRMIRGERGFFRLDYRNLATGKASWIAIAPLSSNGWSVGIVFPRDEFMASVRFLARSFLLLGLLGSAALLVLVIAVSRSITRPLTRLTAAAEMLAAGDFATALPPIRRRDEIGKLAGSFRSMQDSLVRTIRELRQTSGDLLASREQLQDYSRNLELKVAERTRELERKNRELDHAFQTIKTLSDIGRRITASLSGEAIQNLLYESVNTLLDATSFLIMILNEKEGKLECKLSIENGERLPPFEIRLDQKNRFAVWCIDHRAPILMNDVDAEYSRYVSHRSRPLAGKTVQSMIYIPLMIEERVIGIISAQSFEKNAYSQHHLDILNNLATYTAIALDNARAYDEVQRAHRELKEAQAQLIQAEKLASLGQLTAGIAHEIKNPLNFVLNFSELTAELGGELGQALAPARVHLADADRESIEDLLATIQGNVAKIMEHGKRADRIVRGMLLHSRGQGGEKQPVDLNALAREYVMLAFHGLRAQDADFNIKIDFDLDPSLAPCPVVPQDLSRVIINIVNNAGYSTQRKKRERIEAYSPTLRVTTRNLGESAEIRIRDNGQGIPAPIRERIFNPFFTTKPAGQGTGLGLSLSYDIITSGHGGKIDVDSGEGEYAEFIITLPLKPPPAAALTEKPDGANHA